MAIEMGIGKLGFANNIFKRKFRWLFSVSDICVDGASARIPETYVKAASRPNITFDEVKSNLELRDYIDSNREISPLRKANDAYVLDNTMMSMEEQFKIAKKLVDEKLV